LRDAPSIEGVGPDYPPPLAWRAWAVMNHAMLGEFDAAGPEVEALERVLDDPSAGLHARLVATASLGAFASTRGEVARATSLLESAIALGRQSATTSMLPRIASCLAWAHVLAGRTAEAIALLEDVVEQTRSVHHRYLFEEVQCRLGEAYLAAGRLADADRALREALAHATERCARGAEAEVLRLLGDLEGRASVADVAAVAGRYVAAIAIADDLGMRPLAARCRLGLAGLYRRHGRFPESAELLARAVAEFQMMGMSFWLFRTGSDPVSPA